VTRPLVLTSIPQPGDRLAATDGTQFTVDGLLGRGGQGAVFSLRPTGGDSPMCAKVYLGLEEGRVDRIRTRLERLRQRKATPALVLPRRVLRLPWTGHVMDRVEDADSLGALAVFPGGEPVRSWYARTGGLRRRLLLGMALCDAFRDLHLGGLAYCDLSFDNVLVPRKGTPSIRLIDCDNLSLGDDGPSAVAGTPWFIAPEVLAGTHAPDAQTDGHSLAVLLYHLLVLTHPLLGDGVRAGPPENEDAALRGRALDGTTLPWVDDPEDRRNATRAGLPRGLVVSRAMADTFHRAFARGVHERTARPAEGVWADILGRAVDATMTCPGCQNHRWLAKDVCPWCGAAASQPTVLLCAFPEGSRPVVVEKRRRLFARHLLFRQGMPGEGQLAEVEVSRERVVLENQSEEPFALVVGGAARTLRRGEREALSANDTLQLGSRGVLVRVALVGGR
jgi:DNA-binding helix-hairpin-helix protein with protein kinase domain